MKIISLFCLFLFLCSAAKAQDYSCAALSDKATYKDNKSYYKIVADNEGWLFRTKTDFQTKFALDADLLENFQTLNALFKSRDIDLVIALIPTRGITQTATIIDSFDHKKAIKDYNKLTVDLNAMGIKTVSIDVSKPSNNFFHSRDHHWNSAGARAMATELSKRIKTLPAYAAIKKISYKTDKLDDIAFEGGFEKFVQDQCQIDITDEKTLQYKTYPTDQSDLFGDADVPDIYLIGTSNSVSKASHANFDGFLKEYLSANVKNISISGGGYDTALLQFLNAGDLQNHRPKIIIWEFPAYQGYNDISFFKQAIPAIHGACGARAMMNKTIEIKENKFAQDFNVNNVNNVDYFTLTIPDFKKNKIRLALTYADGEKEVYDLRRSKFYEADGKFYFDIDKEKTLKSIEGHLPSSDYATATITLCPQSSE